MESVRTINSGLYGSRYRCSKTSGSSHLPWRSNALRITATSDELESRLARLLIALLPPGVSKPGCHCFTLIAILSLLRGIWGLRLSEKLRQSRLKPLLLTPNAPCDADNSITAEAAPTVLIALGVFLLPVPGVAAHGFNAELGFPAEFL